MKILYIDCPMGAAGDMLTAALLELHPDPAGFLRRLNAALPEGVCVTAEPDEKRGIRGTHVHVLAHGEEEGRGHPEEHGGQVERGHHHESAAHEDGHHEHGGHENEGAHAHHHTHASVSQILAQIGAMDIPEQVRRDAVAVYRRIAEAESAVHGQPVENIHLHELGSLDALADVLAVCWLLYELQPDEICCSPIAVGSGTVKCAHGILPVPAPATERLLRGLPVWAGRERGELCTPTGAALLGHFVRRFGPLPAMTLQKSGIGTGHKDFETANILRLLWGEGVEEPVATLDAAPGDCEQILELRCDLDDMNGEEIAFALERLLEVGALDVFTTPIGMKKSRPAVMLTALCKPEQREELLRCLFRHTSTLGVRESLCPRYTLRRDFRTVETEAGPVRVKCAEGWGVRREKPEFEDLARIARERGIGLREAAALLEDRS